MHAVKKDFAHIVLGDTAKFETQITTELVDSFARLSGDFNPLHIDDTYARTTVFRERIPHGMIAGALFSRLIGMYLPGEKALYLSQTLLFKKPMQVGGTVVVSGEVTHITPSLRAISIKTQVCDAESGTILVSGEAVVKML